MTTKVYELEWIRVRRDYEKEVWAAYSKDKARMYTVFQNYDMNTHSHDPWMVAWAHTKNRYELQHEQYKFMNRWEAQNFAELLESTQKVDEAKIAAENKERHFSAGREWRNIGVINNKKVLVSVSEDQKSAFAIMYDYSNRRAGWTLSRRIWESAGKKGVLELTIKKLGSYSTLQAAQHAVMQLN